MRLREALTSLVYGLSLSGYSVAGTSSHVDIPAGDLASALDLLARETHVEFIYSADDVKGVHTRGAHGELDTESAVRELISGTGLKLKVHPSGAILVTRNLLPDTGPVFAPVAAHSTHNSTPSSADLSARGPEEIVVTASKRPEPLFQVAGAVSAISGAQLEDRGADGRSDYIAFLPGLGMQSFGHEGFNTVFIRGIASQNVASTAAVYVDEIPVGAATAITRNGFFAPDVNPTDLDRVEVLKGPQGTLYGATSMGGVVKYVTRAPNLALPELRLDEDFNLIEGGSAGAKLSVMGSAPVVQDRLGIRLSAFYRHTGGFIDDTGLGGPDTNRNDNRGLRAALLYRPTDPLSLKLTAMTQVNQSHGNDVADYNVATGQPLFGPYAQKRYLAETSSIQLQLYSAELNYQSALFDLIWASGYTRLDPSGFTDETAAFEQAGSGFASPQGPVENLSHDNTRKLTQEMRLVSRRMGAAEFILGGFYQQERDRFVFLDTLIASPGLNFSRHGSDGTLTEYAGFADATLYFSTRYDLTAGYRYSRLHQHLDRFYSGSRFEPASPDEVVETGEDFSEGPSTYLAAARYHANEHLMIYARAASGYRPGGGRSLPAGLPARISDYYTSDTIWSYEVGTKYSALQERLTFDANAFWINWSRIQSLQLVPGTTLVVNANAGTANSRGVELQSTFAPVKDWTVGVYGAYTNARFTQTVSSIAQNGAALTYVPRIAWSAQTQYDRTVLNGWTGTLAADYRFVGARLDTYRTPLPGYGIWNARASLRSDRFRVTLYVNNLTNKYAREGSTLDALRPAPYYFVMAPPRTIGLSAAQTF